MRTKEQQPGRGNEKVFFSETKSAGKMMSMVMTVILLMTISFSASAHCDSYDGPTIKDAIKALETNNVNLVLKWIDEDQEEEVLSLFKTTYNLKNSDRAVYDIVEKHFFETLVRLHRETEGAPYTGLKPSGTTKKIIQLSDEAIDKDSFSDLLVRFNNHIGTVLKEKYDRVASLDKVKNESVAKGREFVEAYVDYTHTLEAIHDILEHGGGQAAHNH